MRFRLFVKKIFVICLFILSLSILFFSALNIYNITYPAPQSYVITTNDYQPYKLSTVEDDVNGYSFLRKEYNWVEIKSFNKPIFQSLNEAVRKNMKNDWQAVVKDVVYFDASNSKSVSDFQNLFPKTYRVVVASYPEISRHTSSFVNQNPYVSAMTKNGWNGDIYNKKVYPDDKNYSHVSSDISDFYIYDILHPTKFYLYQTSGFDPYSVSFRITDPKSNFYGLLPALWRTQLASNWKDNNCFGKLNALTKFVCKSSFSENSLISNLDNIVDPNLKDYSDIELGFKIKTPSDLEGKFAQKNSESDSDFTVLRIYKDPNISLDKAINLLVSNNGDYAEDAKDLKIGYENNDNQVRMVGELLPFRYEVAKILKTSSSDKRLNNSYIIYDPAFSDRFFIINTDILNIDDHYLAKNKIYLSNNLPWYSSFRVTPGLKKFEYMTKSSGIPADLKVEKILPLSQQYSVLIRMTNSTFSYNLGVENTGDFTKGFNFKNIVFKGGTDDCFNPYTSKEERERGCDKNIKRINDSSAINEIKKLFSDKMIFELPKPNPPCDSCLISTNHEPHYIEVFNDYAKSYGTVKNKINSILWMDADFKDWALMEKVDTLNSVLHIFSYQTNSEMIPYKLTNSLEIPLQKQLTDVTNEYSASDYDFFELKDVDLKNGNFSIKESYCSLQYRTCYISRRDKFCTITTNYKNWKKVGSVPNLTLLCSKDKDVAIPTSYFYSTLD